MVSNGPHRAKGHELLLWVSGSHHGECLYLADGERIDLRGPGAAFLIQEG